MSERKINLEEILDKVRCIDRNPDNGQYYDDDLAKVAMLEFGKQLLELAAENSKIEIKTVGEKLIITDIYQKDNYTRIQVNINSILETINKIK